MTTDNPHSAAPGWYPDPSGQAELRYFDGAQWTTHVHGTPGVGAPAPAAPQAQPQPEVHAQPQLASQPSAAAPDPAAAAPRRKRTGLIVGLSIGATAIVAVLAVVIALLVVPQSASARIYTDISEQYDYTDDLLDLARDHEFEFPAEYDLEAVQRAHADPEAFTEGQRPPSYAFQVYYDRALTMETEYFLYQADPGEPVQISGEELGTAFGSSEARIMDVADAVTGWGLHPEYFLVQRVDREGADLAKPIVTRFTVQSSLEPPQVSLQTPAGDGSLQVSWEPVEGATEYIVVTSHWENGSRYYRHAGTTSGTVWSSYSEEEAGEQWQFRQNVDLQLFGGDSADAIAGGRGTPDDEPTSQHDLGVIASDGEHFSPYISHDLRKSAASLPLEKAFYASVALKKWGLSGYIEGMENVQRRFAFTSIDGTTRTTVATINAASVVDLGDRWGLPLLGRGTTLGEWIPITKSSVPDLGAAIAQFNAEAQAAAPPTGMPQFEVATEAITEVAEPVSETPQTPYPVYGSTDLTRFLGAHLIAGTTLIDISAFTGPGSPDPYDALEEAELQNPYARTVRATSLSRDGSTLSVAYAEGTIDDAGQAELLATVDRVIADTVSDGMSDAQKVTALNDWLAAHAEYDHEALAAKDAALGVPPADYRYAWESTGVLLNQRGVCQSYAEAFQALANAAGVQTVVVTGDVVDGGRHAWNKVLIDGAWLAVDTTWNDSSYGNQFLMIPDSAFTDSATRTQDGYWVIDGTEADYATP